MSVHSTAVACMRRRTQTNPIFFFFFVVVVALFFTNLVVFLSLSFFLPWNLKRFVLLLLPFLGSNPLSFLGRWLPTRQIVWAGDSSIIQDLILTRSYFFLIRERGDTFLVSRFRRCFKLVQSKENSKEGPMHTLDGELKIRKIKFCNLKTF